MTEQENWDVISSSIIDAAIDVHSELGPGLLESAYEHCLAFDLSEIGHTVERQNWFQSNIKRRKWTQDSVLTCSLTRKLSLS